MNGVVVVAGEVFSPSSCLLEGWMFMMASWTVEMEMDPRSCWFSKSWVWMFCRLEVT